MIERQSGRKLKILRTDNGGEYTSNEFQAYLKRQGIKHETTIPKTPEQNGVAERMNRTLVESTRTMIFDANLPKRFWAETLSTVVYLRNCSPTKAVENITPFEAWHGYKPEVSHLRVFAYVHIEKDERSKLDPKSQKCVFLGYGTNFKGYRLYDMEKQTLCHSRNVRFDETATAFKLEQPCESEELVKLQSWETEDTSSEVGEENDSTTESNVMHSARVRQSQRSRCEPERYRVWINNIETCIPEPTTVDDALSSTNKHKWKEAMDKEMQSIHENEVWDLGPKPKNRKIFESKWVFKKKLDSDGNIERYKARLVAQGYSQQHGFDYEETFSPLNC